MLATPQGTTVGDAFRQGIDAVVNNAMSAAQREIQQKITELQVERAGLQMALRSTNARPARLEMQGRIDRLDREIADLERAMQRVQRNVDVRQDARQDRQTIAETRPPQFSDFPQARIDPVPIIATTLGILFVAFPLALTISRYIWKRSTNAPAPAITAEQTQRFDRLEQSVDAIAIEVERISENQRYLTKLLGESKQTSRIGS